MIVKKSTGEIKTIIEHLKKGGVIVYPTETAYALGCDVANQKAVGLVFKMKKRAKSKTLPLIVGSLAMVKKYCQMSAAEEWLAKRYWPGALTMVLYYSLRPDSRSPMPLGDKLRGNDNSGQSTLPRALAKGIVAKDGTVAVRVSGNKMARELSQALGRPIVSTSANLTGEGEYCSLDDVKKSFLCHSRESGNPDILLIDGGRLKKRKPSTIVKIVNGRIKILRQGEIKLC